MQNIEQTIISQYGNSPVLNQVLNNMNQYIDPSNDITAFYSTIWDIATAVGYGLDVWGKIVGVARQIQVPNTSYFGFKEGGLEPFGQAPFYPGPSTGTYTLSDTAFRLLILTKALANISDCSIPSFNQLLQNLFAGRGRCYAVDLGGMQMMFTFEFYLAYFEIAVISDSGEFPRPAGVRATLLQCVPEDTFGFSEASISGGVSYQPFGHGTLYSGNGGAQVTPIATAMLDANSTNFILNFSALG